MYKISKIKQVSISQSIICSLIILLIALSCDRGKSIEELLNSNNVGDKIEGAYEAGESGDKKYVPLLLKDAADPRITNILRFKGMSVYQSKMGALKKIYKQEPHLHITYKVDSTVIEYYNKIYQDQLKK